jgi:hypothetical protein
LRKSLSAVRANLRPVRRLEVTERGLFPGGLRNLVIQK